MSTESLHLPIGTRVRVHRLLRRTRAVRPGGRGEAKAWESERVAWVSPRAIYLDGVIAGHRTLTNGTTVWGGEDGTDYRATESVPAYLVAWHPRRELIRVAPIDLEVLALFPELVVVDDDVEPDPGSVLL